MISSRSFGMLQDGREVTLYEISNMWGEYVEFLDFGAAIHGIHVLDHEGGIDNVVLHVKDVKELQERSYEGVTIGRCANRIAYGRYCVDGKEIQFPVREGQHLLHSGEGNYAFRMFQAEPDERSNSVRFTLMDHGEGGFGCSVRVSVRFSFGDDHCLCIAYDMIPDGTTPLCPTNHAYFNLSKGDVRDHYMQIYADKFAVKGGSGIPEGGIGLVEGTPLDYRIPCTLRSVMGWDLKRYDDCYIINNEGFRKAASLYSPESGRRMNVYTDMPALVVFTPPPNERQRDPGRYPAICLETQYVPNAVNCPEYKTCVFQRGEHLCSQTIYEFLIEC